MRTFMQRLQRIGELTPEEALQLEALATASVRVTARRELSPADCDPSMTHVIASGVACRYAVLPSGRRQILAYFLPGDRCELLRLSCGTADYVGTLTAVKMVGISTDALANLAGRAPRVGFAFAKLAAVNQEIGVQWMLSLGSRTALQRMAHLLCELFTRLSHACLTNGASCNFPLRQTDLAEALALTPVHTCRTVRALRQQGIVTLAKRQLFIHDFAALSKLADFDPGYLGPVPDDPRALRHHCRLESGSAATCPAEM